MDKKLKCLLVTPNEEMNAFEHGMFMRYYNDGYEVTQVSMANRRDIDEEEFDFMHTVEYRKKED